MNSGKTIFAQLMDFLPIHEFRRCVERYKGHYQMKSFSCWDQFLCMAFAQLTYRESLRDIQACLRSAKSKLYHMGIRGKVSRNTLAHANQVRDWRIYADFANILINHARHLYSRDSFGTELAQTVYALDSTTIDLCLSLFPWAKFRKHKAAVKLHTLLDLRGSIPTVVIITHGKVHDVRIIDQILLEPGAIYIMDRGYLDFSRLYAIHQASVFFVTRAKRNFRFKRLYSRPIEKNTGVQCDQIIVLEGFYSKKDYPDKLRRIRYFDAANNKRFVFLTNNFTLSSSTIAKLYQCRWQIGASRKGRIIQSVEVRPRLKDSRLRSLEGTVERKQGGKALRQHLLKGGCATLQVVTCSERRCSLVTRNPMAETVDNVRRQQEITGRSQRRYLSSAGYQRRHEAKDYAETGEALDARRRNLDEEFLPITLNGKWQEWRQGGGSGCSTADLRAAKRAGREGPGPVDIPLGKVRQG